MLILAIADDDSAVCQLERCKVDVLVSCGDIADITILRAVEYYQPDVAFAVRGNHDLDVPFPDGIIDLHLEVKSHRGLKFGGFGGSWRYKNRGNNLFTQEEAETLLDGFPAVDVFIAHNSPFGIHERDADVHQGFRAFNGYIRRTSPTYFIHGHQHNGKTGRCERTQVCGVISERMFDDLQLR